MFWKHKHNWSYYPMIEGEEEHGVQVYSRFCLKCGEQQEAVYHTCGERRFGWKTIFGCKLSKKRRREFKAKLDVQIEKIKENNEIQNGS